MQNNQYYIVYYWMKNVLDLRKSNAAVFAIIWGFNKDGKNFTGSAQYLAELGDLSRSGVFTSLKALEEMGYIERFGEPTEIAITEKVYKLLSNSGVEFKQKTQSRNWTKEDNTVQKLDSHSPEIGLPSPEIGLDESRNWTAILRKDNIVDNIVNKIVVEVESEEVKPPSLPPHRVAANPLPEFSATTTAQKLSILKEQANEFYKTLIADDIQTELLRKNNRVGNNPLTMEQFRTHLKRFCKYKVETAQKGWHRYDDFRHNFSLYLPTSIARAKEEGGAVWVRPETATFKRPAN